MGGCVFKSDWLPGDIVDPLCHLLLAVLRGAFHRELAQKSEQQSTAVLFKCHPSKLFLQQGIEEHLDLKAQGIVRAVPHTDTAALYMPFCTLQHGIDLLVMKDHPGDHAVFQMQFVLFRTVDDQYILALQ